MSNKAWEEADRAYRLADGRKTALACEMAGMLQARSSADELLARFHEAQRECDVAVSAMVAACEAA